ncbi:hypothetical protein L3Q82_007385 [Scortum barcoo]|uniref:Uncharacterized protein n=1 Tax=Scortum barcoo TaxID=214431 RepID=A0ACB8WT19_9TELE|nr:hypothetical protein L3Q82_007385 [Scortum barcoo]
MRCISKVGFDIQDSCYLREEAPKEEDQAQQRTTWPGQMATRCSLRWNASRSHLSCHGFQGGGELAEEEVGPGGPERSIVRVCQEGLGRTLPPGRAQGGLTDQLRPDFSQSERLSGGLHVLALSNSGCGRRHLVPVVQGGGILNPNPWTPEVRVAMAEEGVLSGPCWPVGLLTQLTGYQASKPAAERSWRQKLGSGRSSVAMEEFGRPRRDSGKRTGSPALRRGKQYYSANTLQFVDSGELT